jgi:hypothetical protein
VGLFVSAVVAAGLIEKSLGLNHVDEVRYLINLSAAYALLPLLFYSPVVAREESLEKIICVQQTWLRLLFLQWSLGEGVNISHYDLYQDYVLRFGWIALVVIAIAVIWRRRFMWTLVQQSVISLLVLSVSLDRLHTDPRLVGAWILLLGLSTLLPKSTDETVVNRTKFLKRLECGAFGGGVFWSFILIAHLSSAASVEGSMLWTFVVFLLGFFSWLRDVPSPAAGRRSATSDVFLLGARAVVQLALAVIFIFPFRGG